MANNLNIEKLLSNLVEIKEKIQDNKAILKHYKIRSDHLTELKNAYKELKKQIDDEKKRIEDDFLLDNDYEQAKKDELEFSAELKEKISELKEILFDLRKDEDLVSEEYNIKNEPLRLQVERVIKVYVNGSEQK